MTKEARDTARRSDQSAAGQSVFAFHIHCKSKEAAQELLSAIKVRLGEARLSIKESKTKIAYCRDYRRRAQEQEVSFEFLGFSFKPMRMLSKQGGYFTGFGMEISPSNQKKLTDVIREERTFINTTLDISALAASINGKLRGRINYYPLLLYLFL